MTHERVEEAVDSDKENLRRKGGYNEKDPLQLIDIVTSCRFVSHKTYAPRE
jgi:hypothetical protein